MNDEISSLNQEIKLLKEKLNNKNNKLKIAKSKINKLTSGSHRQAICDFLMYEEHYLLLQMTKHLDEFIYEVEFKFKERKYIEPQVPSFGTRWLKTSLIIYLANKKDIMASSFDIEIIHAKKLW